MKKSILTLSVLLLVFTLLIGILALTSGQPITLDTKLAEAKILSGGSTEDLSGSEVYIHVGSPLILSQNKISPLDPNNLDVAATIVDDRTLVPLRALSEYFHAAVSYDGTERQAIIEFNDKRYIFPIDENRYFEMDGQLKKEIVMDTRTMILNDRTMVPLRVICEDILERKVSYFDKVIAISDNEMNLQSESTLVTDIKAKIGSALKVQSIDELKSAILQQSQILYDGTIRTSDVVSPSANTAEKNEAASATSDSKSSSQPISSSGADYSTTNTQVEGIDEADIVKTDGKYIYIAGNNAVRIVNTDSGKLADTAVIKLPQDKNVREIYIDGNRLVLLGSRFERVDRPTDPGKEVFPATDTVSPAVDKATTTSISSKMIMPYYSKSYSFVDIYDISDQKNPAFIKGHEMEGNYQSSRKNGEVVYLITNTYVYNNVILPMMKDTAASNEPVSMDLKDIMIMPGYPTSGYVIVSAINIKNNDKTEVEAITTSGHQIYMNSTALYLTANGYDGQSVITKFKIDGMNIGYAGSGKVKGYILNQFSMDEYNGYFRVATTWNNENNLFVLDDSLNITGSVTGLAKGERIYSVRFMGDKGYIVTFRTMDPLFVFDLSDPKNPKVTGELKIPGFSNYLHPVGENLILGIGQDTYEIFKKDASGNDVVVGARQGGIKLSLFDVSDMGKPKEISKYILGDSGSYTDVFYDHKAVMFDYSSKIVAFDATYTIDANYGNYKHGAAFFNFGDNSINLKGVVDYIQPEVSGLYIPHGRRVIYIGDELYYIQDGIISSYNYSTLEKISTLMLK